MRNAQARRGIHGGNDRSSEMRWGRVGARALGGDFGRAGGDGLFLRGSLARDGHLLANGGEPGSLVLLLASLRVRVLVFTSDPKLPVQQAGQSELALANLGNVEAGDLGPRPVRVDAVVKELVCDDQGRQESPSRTQEGRRGREALEVWFGRFRFTRAGGGRRSLGSDRENVADSLQERGNVRADESIWPG